MDSGERYRSGSDRPLTGSLEECRREFNELFGETKDLRLEELQIGQKQAMLCYLLTITDAQLLTQRVLQPIGQLPSDQSVAGTDELEMLCARMLGGSAHIIIQTNQDAVQKMLEGYSVIFIEGVGAAVAVFTEGGGQRGIQEPTTQTIVKGPKDGFVEDLRTNLSLLRKRIRNHKLRIETFTIGTDTGTNVCLVYMKSIANEGIVDEARKRLSDIHTNAIFETGNIEEFIADKTLTPFPTVYSTERPDAVSAHLVSGKAAILVDGTPFAITLPTVFNDFMVAPEDYYQSFLMGSFLRFIRYLSFMFALMLPSLYVSVITYHHELIPTPLLISVIAQREGVPFPAVVEAFLMEVTFEILREAGVRMPRAVGGTISIVGGLVIGQAAVEAGIISNTMVIVVALTAISSFVAPYYIFSISSRLLRFGLIVLGGVFGLYGVFLGLMVMVGHLCSLRSFGVPYLAPIAPFILKDQKDIFFRLPVWASKLRPQMLKPAGAVKQQESESPSPPPMYPSEGKSKRKGDPS
ncbi:spore germination protein [Paenibacillus sambharensis]|uniref:Spore germination protein n=1 Tax=Paenibacillus sambharensis TaxID=1803190 RepID=A0A2W1LRW2_9BACL|nr:spore germination protein [Paenibacillus sambharensis]PZD94187.1 spore germination protein [Paenibacillus sambharensis]